MARVVNIAMLVPVYKTVHFTTDKSLYAEIACNTMGANIGSSITKDVTCGRCRLTNKFEHESRYQFATRKRKGRQL